MKFIAITKKEYYAHAAKIFDAGQTLECERIYHDIHKYYSFSDTSYPYTINVIKIGHWTQEHFNKYFYSQQEIRKMKLDKLKNTTNE